MKSENTDREMHGGSDVAYIHSGKRNDDGTGQNFEKPRHGREKKQEEGTQLAPGRVVALSSNRPCARGPGGCFVCVSYAQKNSIARALLALARVATPNDISRRRHAGARLPRSATRTSWPTEREIGDSARLELILDGDECAPSKKPS